MKTIYHSAESRGHANHGWLDSYHSFSFGNYYNPEKVHFGALRVLNDDNVSGGMGFGRHPHDNMEIISIPLEGNLEHQDSMGNKTVIKKGEVQIMSAGTGVSHSEKNQDLHLPVKFLQIWVFPDQQRLVPSYDQKVFDSEDRKNKFQTIVSPKSKNGEGVKINQNAWFNLIDLDNQNAIKYHLNDSTNGVYVFVLEGDVEINGQKLGKRDALGLWETESFEINASANSEILLMEVPMAF